MDYQTREEFEALEKVRFELLKKIEESCFCLRRLLAQGKQIERARERLEGERISLQSQSKKELQPLEEQGLELLQDYVKCWSLLCDQRESVREHLKNLSTSIQGSLKRDRRETEQLVSSIQEEKRLQKCLAEEVTAFSTPQQEKENLPPFLRKELLALEQQLDANKRCEKALIEEHQREQKELDLLREELHLLRAERTQKENFYLACKRAQESFSQAPNSYEAASFQEHHLPSIERALARLQEEVNTLKEELLGAESFLQELLEPNLARQKMSTRTEQEIALLKEKLASFHESASKLSASMKEEAPGA